MSDEDKFIMDDKRMSVYQRIRQEEEKRYEQLSQKLKDESSKRYRELLKKGMGCYDDSLMLALSDLRWDTEKRIRQRMKEAHERGDW